MIMELIGNASGYTTHAYTLPINSIIMYIHSYVYRHTQYLNVVIIPERQADFVHPRLLETIR